MIRFLLVFAGLSSNLFALPLVLEVSSELTLEAPWNEPVTLAVDAGTYRLEATDLAGTVVEVVVERKESDGWHTRATNRALSGILTTADWSVATGEQWRVRPAKGERRTVVIRLQRPAFSGLRDSLKQTLTAGSDVPLPLRLRNILGEGTTLLAAAAGPRGSLWVASGTNEGLEVWDALRGTRLGTVRGGPWSFLEIQSEGPFVIGRGPLGDTAARWTGTAWTSEPVPLSTVTSPLGQFRSELLPLPRLWKATPAGWADLELPQNAGLDKMLWGPTEEGLYVMLASGRSKARAFYLWNPREGWTAFEAPAAEGPPEPGLWAATSAGGIVVLEGHDGRLSLRAFDGDQWKSAIDLSVLAPEGAKAAVLLPPSPISKTGTLILSAAKISVYDLP